MNIWVVAHFLAAVNNVAVNTHLQISIHDMFPSLWGVGRSGLLAWSLNYRNFISFSDYLIGQVPLSVIQKWLGYSCVFAFP